MKEVVLPEETALKMPSFIRVKQSCSLVVYSLQFDQMQSSR